MLKGQEINSDVEFNILRIDRTKPRQRADNTHLRLPHVYSEWKLFPCVSESVLNTVMP